MALNLSDIARTRTGTSAPATTASENVEIDNVPITPDATIGLEANDVGEAITELATDIYELNNIQDLTALFNNAIS